MNKIIKIWILPLIVSIGIFIAVSPTFAQFVQGVPDLTQYLAENSVEVGSEIGENGYQQVYYIYNGNKVFITNTNYSNGEPVSEREYIAWMGEIGGAGWQVFIYHIPSSTTTQISFTSNNANPKISGGRVVWEGWIDNSWQIFFYDGKSVQQLTSGDSSMYPDINGDFISYSRKDISGTWRAVVYSISKKEAKDITSGTSAKYSKVRGGKIYLAEGTEEFPLTVDDLFLLNLVPLTSENTPTTVSEDEIIGELEATSSAVIEEPITTITPTPTETLPVIR